LHRTVDAAAQRRWPSVPGCSPGKFIVKKSLPPAVTEPTCGLIKELLSEYELLDGRVRASSLRYAGLNRPAEVKLPEVQLLLDPETALLEIFPGKPERFPPSVRHL
jgi:hypothetical protein